MEYVYTALLLHSAGKQIDEKSVEKVLDAAGVKADSARVKAMVASLKDVNIEEAIKNAAAFQAVPAQPAASEAKHEAKEAKKEQEEKKTEEEAAEGLSSLFG